MKSILFVNHRSKQCGVYQYGYRFFKALQLIPDYHSHYVECTSAEDFLEAVKKNQPDAIIYNYHHATLPFATPELVRSLKKPIHICLAHELSQEMADSVDGSDFHYYLYGDPTLKTRSPLVFPLGRFLPDYQPSKARQAPESPVIGSYGFAGDLKGFDRLVKMVENEFDSATIRLNIPPNNAVDLEDQLRQSIIQKCKNALQKPGIKLEISEKFFSEEELLDFLASNDLNVFPYLDKQNQFYGIASATDFALAARRPVAISDCRMFRHLWDVEPSIVVPMRKSALLLRTLLNLKGVKQQQHRRFNYRSLREILRQGIKPLHPLYEQWNEKHFSKDLRSALSEIVTGKLHSVPATSPGRY